MLKKIAASFIQNNASKVCPTCGKPGYLTGPKSFDGLMPVESPYEETSYEEPAYVGPSREEPSSPENPLIQEWLQGIQSKYIVPSPRRWQADNQVPFPEITQQEREYPTPFSRHIKQLFSRRKPPKPSLNFYR